jgi:ATP-binding cassette, subfamily F, member 3
VPDALDLTRRAANGSGGAAAANARHDNGASSQAKKGKPKSSRKGPSKNRLSAQQQAERAIEEAEAALRALEAELTDPAAWATRYESAKSEARHTAATRSVEEAYARLEGLVD